jgi:hypothetical protein
MLLHFERELLKALYVFICQTEGFLCKSIALLIKFSNFRLIKHKVREELLIPLHLFQFFIPNH